MLGVAVTAAVAALLVATVFRQPGRAGPRGRLLGALAVVPQWKFFGDSRLGVRDDALDDLHLVARDWMGGDLVGPWQPVLSPAERRWTQAVWNPSRRPDSMLLSYADDLAGSPDAAWREGVASSLPYLVLLRQSLDAAPRSPQAKARQFAIVRTRGRGERTLSVAFVSGWHAW